MNRLDIHRQKNRKPSRDKVRRGGTYGEFNPATVRVPHVLTRTILPDEAAAATHALNQTLATHEGLPADVGPEAIRPGPMCLRALIQSPHFQGHLVRMQTHAQIQPAQ